MTTSRSTSRCTSRWAPSEEEALAIAHEQWRTNVFPPPLCWDLDTVEQFDAAARHVRPEDLRDAVLVSSDLGRHAAWLQELAALGVDVAAAASRRPGSRAVRRRLRRPRAAGAARVSLSATGDVWWRNAVVYCLDVETFLDSDGDGVGDLTGLCERIDYLDGIGVELPLADAVLPLGPARRRLRHHRLLRRRPAARDARRPRRHDPHRARPRDPRDRRPRPNHTSDRHPWFQAAREGRGARTTTSTCGPTRSRRRSPGDVVFPDREKSNWAYDRKARRWYLHRFYSHQPDLNVANPAVRDEIAQVAGFWLEQGLLGFRLDAVPFLIEPDGDAARRARRTRTSCCASCGA